MKKTMKSVAVTASKAKTTARKLTTKAKPAARKLSAKANPSVNAKRSAKAKPARNLVTRARKAVSTAVHNAEMAMRKVADDIVRAVN